MIYKAVLGEVKIGMEEDLREQARRKVRAKLEELEEARSKVMRVKKEYDELLESEVVKEKPTGWITLGGSCIGEVTDWSITTGGFKD